MLRPVHKTSIILAVLLGSISIARAETLNTLTDEEKNAGFELLFNGKDLEGWEQKGNWKVEEGAFGRAGQGAG